MALFLSHKEPLYRWGVWKMDESVDTLLDLLPEREYYEREVQRFVASHRRLEWLSVRALLFRLLGEHKEVCYQPSGKPYLADYSYFISISHTKGYVAVMLASFTPAGIDIEQYAQRVHKVSDRYIRSDEQTEPYQGDMTWGLLLHWSAKEAVFKRMENADADLRKLRLTHFIPQEQGTFQVQELATEQQELYSVGYRICPDFVLTWTLS